MPHMKEKPPGAVPRMPGPGHVRRLLDPSPASLSRVVAALCGCARRLLAGRRRLGEGDHRAPDVTAAEIGSPRHAGAGASAFRCLVPSSQ